MTYAFDTFYKILFVFMETFFLNFCKKYMFVNGHMKICQKEKMFNNAFSNLRQSFSWITDFSIKNDSFFNSLINSKNILKRSTCSKPKQAKQMMFWTWTVERIHRVGKKIGIIVCWVSIYKLKNSRSKINGRPLTQRKHIIFQCAL